MTDLHVIGVESTGTKLQRGDASARPLLRPTQWGICTTRLLSIIILGWLPQTPTFHPCLAGLQRRRELLLQKHEDLRQLRLKRQKRLKKESVSLSPSCGSAPAPSHAVEALAMATRDDEAPTANEWALTGDDRCAGPSTNDSYWRSSTY